MSDPQDVLDGIAQRVDRMAKPDPTRMRIAPDTYLTDDDRRAGDYDPIGHIAGDLRGLVAALRAVMDLHAEDAAGDCADCSEDYQWTTYPCPTVQAITEALGGAT